jgi:hypothetical protein
MTRVEPMPGDVAAARHVRRSAMKDYLRIGRVRVDVPCTVDVGHTPHTLHAHVELDGVDVGPGDEVLVHGAPAQVPYGEHRVFDRHATVTRASWLGRLWTRATSRFEITMLYEVSFSPGATARAPRRSKP